MTETPAPTDAELRAAVMDISRGWCEWPECRAAATEAAHIHSKGMGGRASAQTLANTMAACPMHARITDGELPPSGTLRLYGAEVAGLFERLRIDPPSGAAPGSPRLAHAIAEALTAHIRRERGWATL